MPQILDVTANENARYERNELEFCFTALLEKANSTPFTVSPPVMATTVQSIFQINSG